MKYFEWLGEQVSDGRGQRPAPSRRERLRTAMTAIKEHDKALSHALVEGLASIDGVKVWGITDLNQLDRCVPTVSYTTRDKSPRAIAEYLAGHGIYVWDGNYCALAIMERLDLQKPGGTVRVGPAHDDRLDEVAWLVDVFKAIPGATHSQFGDAPQRLRSVRTVRV